MILMNKPLPLLFILSLIFGLTHAEGDIPCRSDIEDGISGCPALHSCINDVCVHKELFPLTSMEIFGTVLLMFLAGLANAGGLGGGALLTPILLIFFNYSPNKAIMIVYSIVFGGSLGNFLNVAFQRNPTTGKSFVDYDLTLICMPIMIAGANIGVLLNRVFLPIIVLVGLIGTMIYTGKKVYAKAKKTYAEETNKQKESPLLEETKKGGAKVKPEYDIELSVLDHSRGQTSSFDFAEGPRMSAEFLDLLDEDEELFPKKKLLLIGAMIAFNLFILVIRGSKTSESMIGIDYCKTGYWILFILGLAGCYLFYRKGSQSVQNRLDVKKRYNFKPKEGEFTISPENMKKIASLSIVTGIAAGLLGIGGGMVMSPFLLQLGMGPQALAATVGFFVVQTSFITLFQSFYSGDVTGTETLFFMTVAFVGSMGVSMFLNYLINKYKRPSILLFALSLVVYLSLAIMPIFAVWKSIDAPAQMFVSNSLC